MSLYIKKTIATVFIMAFGLLFLGACQDHHFVSYEEMGPIPEPGSKEAMDQALKNKKAQATPKILPNVAPGAFTGTIVAGTVKLAPELKGNAPKDWTLYVIARPRSGGPPLAAAKAEKISFPFSFRLNEKNVMMGEPKPGMILNVEARLDSDGDPITKNDADLFGKASGETKLGDKSVVITLKKKSG